ncbi:hypothetical protein C1H46_019045 [Malus baccata]|uniref:Uncharacterized protein n=1 Tax=Malus baccata TaxID=106549 RepID=A0A540MA66_MALBA|nr:hypothetical protein C1H46_019045 [Malus baccata]
MSDRVARSYHDSEGTSEVASHPYESVWMAHWMCTSCKSETKACGHVSIRYEEAQQHNCGVKKHSLFRGFGEVTEPKRLRKMDGGFSLAESSKKTRKAISEGQSFPMFSVPPKASVAKPNQKNSTFHGGVLTECSPPALPACIPTDACSLEATSPPPERQVKYHNFLDNNSLAISKSFQDESTRSDSKIVPHQLKGGPTFSSFLCSEEEINLSNSLFASPQHVTNSYNHTLAHDKNFDNNFVSRRSGGSLPRQNDMVLLQHNPSTSSKQQPNFFSRNFQEMQNQSGIGLLSSHTSPQEVTELEKVFHRSLPSLQRSVHNTETMRICATVNAEEESSRGPPMFSKTTHHFQITKKTGVNLPEQGQMFRQSTASTKLKGKAFGDLFGFSTDYGLPAQPRLKLLPYRSPTDSNGEEDVRDVEAYALESSSETDILDMDAFQDNLLPGVASSASDKHVESSKKSSKSRSAFTSGGEENGARLPYSKLPDINQELPDSAEERETSTSRTQSLDAEHLLSHAEQPTNSNSNSCREGSQGLEIRSSWIKRLKLTATQPAYGTKSSNSRFLGKEQMVPDQAAMLLRDGESSPIDSARKGQNITLSHSWIQRWSKVPSQKKSEKVDFQSQCSKPTVDEFQKKQFPSIAAMALMGKAMNGFHPCEFTNKGSFVVWSTKEIK